MRIRDIVVELDTPLDPAGTAVGKNVGKAGYGAGYAVGKIASKFGAGKTDPNLTNKDRSPNILRAIGQGMKQGAKEYLIGKKTDYATRDWHLLIDKVVDGDKVVADELNNFIRELPTIKLSWKVDRNMVTAALNKYAKGEPIDSNEKNALKILSSDLEKI